MTDSKVDRTETKRLEKMSKKIIDFEGYESVMRQSRKVLTRMDEVLDNCTNITPEETSEWKDFWTNMLEESLKKSSSKVG